VLNDELAETEFGSLSCKDELVLGSYNKDSRQMTDDRYIELRLDYYDVQV